MNAETFCEQFATFAEAPNGVAKLRELVFQLAVQGKVVPQDHNDEPASALFSQIQAERSRLIAEGVMRRSKPLPPVSNDEQLFQIPTQWTWIRFDDVGDWGAGATPNRGRLDYFGGNIKWFKSGELNDAYIDDSEEKITELALKECSLRENEPGDVLVAMYGATIGKVAILNVPATTNQAVCACTCHSGIFNRYLFLMLKAFKPYFISNSSGAAQPNFSKEKIVRTPFPLPPLAEQQRIVGKVDQLLGLCDELAARQAARREARSALVGATLDRLVSARSSVEFPAHAHRLRDHFDRLFDTPTTIPQLRQAILQLAVQGQLVPQDPNDEPASVTHGDADANNIEHVPFAIPTGWSWRPVSGVFDVSGGITKNPKRAPIKNHYPYLRVANVQRGRLKLEEIERFELCDGELERWRLEPGDVLVVEGNGSEDEIGRCALWNGEIADCVHQNHIIRCRPLIHDVQNFVLLFLNSPAGIAEMKERAITTSGLYSLSVGKIRSLVIPLPPLSEQKRIVSKVTELLSLCDALEAKLTQAESASTQLLSAAVHYLLTKQH